jgi:hypothetical protein
MEGVSSMAKDKGAKKESKKTPIRTQKEKKAAKKQKKSSQA